MIRRNTDSSPSSPSWLLIPQVEHAHLSAELALHWRTLHSEWSDHHDSLATILKAVRRHDDGWEQVDEELTVYEQQAVPRDYLEMQAEESAVIWAHSIDRARDMGPLGQWIIARHFLSFWQDRVRKHRDDQSPEAKFVHALTPQLAVWADQVILQFGWSFERLQQLGAVLPFFDYLSLILCGGDQPSGFTLNDWRGRPTVWSARLPDAPDDCGKGNRLRDTTCSYVVSPWPFAASRLDLYCDAFYVSSQTIRQQSIHRRSCHPISDAVIVPGCLHDATRCRLNWRLLAE